MKELQCIPDAAGIRYKDWCIYPNLYLPERFNIPKFDIIGGVGNPMAHLRAYCYHLVGVGRDETLLLRLFTRRLSGEALKWFISHETRQRPSRNALTKDFIDRFSYNIEIVPVWYSLEKIKRKSTESYREFAYNLRKKAARVRGANVWKINLLKCSCGWKSWVLWPNHIACRSKICWDSQSWLEYLRRVENGKDSPSLLQSDY